MLTRLKFYLRIILRLTWKYKTRSMVGLFGLVFGLACLVPATYWLRYETSYDSTYPDADRLYRVYTYDKEAGKDNELVSGILSRELGKRIPALANSTLFFIEPTDYKTASEPFVRLRTLFTDSTFLKVFPQRFIAGDAYAPLAVENQIVLTESVAKRLYGGAEAAIGQSLQSIGLTQSDPPYMVVAVVKDPPRATNLPFDAFLAHNQISLQKNYEDASGKAIWSFATLRMYARLPEGADPEELTERTRLFPAEAHANKELEVRLLPIKDERYHLNSDVPFTLGFIQLFVIAGLLLLTSALFNFLNANGIQSMQQLHEKIADMNTRYYDLRREIVKAERRIAVLTERGEMWAQYNEYKTVHKQLARVKPEKRELFEQRHSRELILYDAAARYLKELKDSGEEITPKAWQREIDLLTAQKQVDTIDMKAMREELKAVERLRKAADQLARQERDKPRDRGPER